jgi:hypothetical protein
MRLIPVALACLCACNTSEAPASAPVEVAAATPVGAKSAEKFGAPLSGQPTVALASVLADPDGFTDKTVTISGEVRKACSNKGCWMEIAPTTAAEAQGCRVTFKDYGFFVPLDSAGARAVVEGVVGVKTVPAAQVAHLEAEGAKFERKFPDGSARELRVVANGVELFNRPGASAKN